MKIEGSVKLKIVSYVLIIKHFSVTLFLLLSSNDLEDVVIINGAHAVQMNCEASKVEAVKKTRGQKRLSRTSPENCERMIVHGFY
jgi:hypothetical protein